MPNLVIKFSLILSTPTQPNIGIPIKNVLVRRILTYQLILLKECRIIIYQFKKSILKKIELVDMTW